MLCFFLLSEQSSLFRVTKLASGSRYFLAMAQYSKGLRLTFRRFQSTGSTHIPAYKASTGSSMAMENRVPAYQKFFQIRGGDPFVFIRGSKDMLIYRGCMTFAFTGIGLTLYGIYQMATGTMKKKER